MVKLTTNPIYRLKDDFVNERDLIDYTENNIELFCMQCIGVVYKSHIREYKVESYKRKSKSIDLLITDINDNIILVEVKKPIYICQIQYALGQLLFYSTLYKKQTGIKPYKLILLSSKFDQEIINTIKEFNLPVSLVGLDKTEHLLHDVSHLN